MTRIPISDRKCPYCGVPLDRVPTRKKRECPSRARIEAFGLTVGPAVDFMKPLGLSQNRLALNIGVHPRRINEIVLGKRSVSADTALRLARYFGNSPQFWLGLQAEYDLDVTEDLLGDRLEREVRAYISP